MDTPTDSSVFGTLFLRFCRSVAEREWEYSIVFIVSNARHVFWGKMVVFVMIIAPFRASVGKTFGWFFKVLGDLFEVLCLLCLTIFEGNRVTASDSE